MRYIKGWHTFFTVVRPSMSNFDPNRAIGINVAVEVTAPDEYAPEKFMFIAPEEVDNFLLAVALEAEKHFGPNVLTQAVGNQRSNKKGSEVNSAVALFLANSEEKDEPV